MITQAEIKLAYKLFARVLNKIVAGQDYVDAVADIAEEEGTDAFAIEQMIDDSLDTAMRVDD